MGAEGSEGGAPGCIVVADDDPTALAFVVDALGRAGFETVACADGTEAVNRVRRGGVSLVLLDGVMPRMGGLECCRLIKAIAGDAFLPVILVAAEGDVASRVTGLKNGADDFLAKPVDAAELVARVANLLRIRQMHEAVRSAKSRLEGLAGRDEHAPLFTEAYLRSRLAQEYRRAERYEEQLAVAVIRTAGLEAWTREAGHAAGRAAYAALAERLAASLRGTDIAARHGRTGMAAILPVTHLEGALAAAERAWTTLTAPVSTDAGSYSGAVYVGVALFPGHGITSPDALLASAEVAADEALARADAPICVAQQSAYFWRPSGA